jgi:ribonuclease HI
MYFDSSLMIEGEGAGVLLISPSGDKLRYTHHLHFQATNNVVEYKALLRGIQAATELSAQCHFIPRDSKMVINQVMKEFTCRNMRMEAYCNKV